jgi:hypothetical protein
VDSNETEPRQINDKKKLCAHLVTEATGIIGTKSILEGKYFSMFGFVMSTTPVKNTTALAFRR